MKEEKYFCSDKTETTSPHGCDKNEISIRFETLMCYELPPTKCLAGVVNESNY